MDWGYYPFGLIMSGISSRAAGGIQNRRKYNEGTELESGEFSDGSGLELYSTAFRGYDPQIGRFHQIDPLSEITWDWSPYTYALNNPVNFNDPLGLTATQDSIRAPDGQMVADKGSMEEVVVTAKARKKVPEPYAEIVSIGLNGNEESYSRIKEARRQVSDPTVMRKLDGQLLRNIMAGAILHTLDKAFTAIDIVSLGMSRGRGTESPLEIPFVGVVLQPIVSDMFQRTDTDLFEDLIKLHGYKGFAAFMRSSSGRRSNLTGVFVTKEVMESILKTGGLDLRIHNAVNRPGWFPDTPNGAGAAHQDYFIFYPGSQQGVVKQFGVLPIK
jgi:RHS repeat-associated protein